MDLLNVLLNKTQSGPVDQIGRQFGLDDSTTKNLLGQLMPALTRGLRNNAKEKGVEALAKALKTGGHQKYLDDPTALGSKSAIEDGNGILGHILGSKDASRNVAAYAAKQSGVDTGIIKKLLPMVASLAMGTLSKQTDGGSKLAALTGEKQGGTGMLGSLLDSDKDGDVMDDVIGLARKLF